MRNSRYGFWIVVCCLFCVIRVSYAVQADIKALAKEINNDMRALEKMQKGDAAAARLAEIRVKIDKMRSIDPSYFEIRVIETKYKRLTSIYGVKEQAAPAAKSPSTGPATAAPKQSTVSNAEKEQALQDWEAIVALKKDFVTRLEEVIPTYVKNIIYTESDADAVLAKIAALRKEAPAVKAKVVAFSAKYGNTADEIDRKIYDLTPKDNSVGMYDPKNQRPSDSPGHCFTELSNGLTNLEEAPKIEAKRILTNVLQNLDLIEGFVVDTARDKRYAQVEQKLQLALQFNPDDAEVKEWLTKIRGMRAQSKLDIEKALDNARFPGHMSGFAGPGSVTDLAASCLKYFNQNSQGETTVAVSVAGNWVVAKRNIFGNPIQWGLPIWAVSYKPDNKEIARVFKLTILTNEGLGIAKSPPWTGVWVGDSYRMRTKNIK
jgi:hypothetical protein